MKRIEKGILRLTYSIVAVGMGSLIMLALTKVGEATRGPLENTMVQVSSAVRHAETMMVSEVREQTRAGKLRWFAPYANDVAKLKHPEMILVGAHDSFMNDSFEGVERLEDSLQTNFPLVHIYAAWGSEEQHEFPEDQVKTILSIGSVPVITWEPWLHSFSPDEYKGLRPEDERGINGMRDVDSGLYDNYIVKWARAAAGVKKPLFVRLGHEMNDPYRYQWGPQNNKPAHFVAAWRHVHDIFVREGATNIIWVWNPHQAYGYFDAYYPGADYVDYVGVAVLNFGTAASWSQWWTFDEIFGNYYADLEAFGKPIMIAELGSLGVGGKREQWFAGAFDNLHGKYPSVKSVLFFHVSDDKTTTQNTLSWYFIYDKTSLMAAREGLKTINN